jgi:DNA-binding response OmpR family regulator
MKTMTRLPPREPGPARILIADDEPQMRALLHATVESLGYQARTARGGQEVLRMARAEPPDAVLLDVAMSDMDGLEVCRRLRARPATAAVPILMVTAVCDLQQQLQGFEAGADDYIGKPFEPRELAARLRAQLERAAARSQVAQLSGVLATLRLVSHEFNNPLQAVVGGLDLLRMAREGDHPMDEEEALAMITDGAERLRELARRLVQITEPSFKDSPIGPMLDIEASR